MSRRRRAWHGRCVEILPHRSHPIRAPVVHRILAAVVLAAAGLPLGGCVGLRGLAGSQPAGLGDVRVSATVCASESAGCPGRGNSATAVGDGSVGQILLAYRIASGSTVPAPPVTQGTTFSASPTYQAELQRLAPAPAGTRWAGFISTPVTYSAARSADVLATATGFTLPTTPGEAFQGPFRVRPVVGARGVTAAAPASRPVACGASLYEEQKDGDSVVVCVDAPAPAEVATDLGVVVQDVAVVPATTRVPGPAGSAAVVPFIIRNAGKGAPPLQLTLSAATTLPGAAVAPSPATLVPAPGGDHQALVVVGVPARAKPGIHGVTLRVAAPGRGVREMTTRLVVTRPVAPLAAGPRGARRVRLDWRSDRRAGYYNLQIFDGRRKVVSLFPTRSARVLRLRPGRYRMIVWSGIGGRRPARYAPRPWVNRTLTVRSAAAPRP